MPVLVVRAATVVSVAVGVLLAGAREISRARRVTAGPAVPVVWRVWRVRVVRVPRGLPVG
jgi:hypothetical protein